MSPSLTFSWDILWEPCLPVYPRSTDPHTPTITTSITSTSQIFPLGFSLPLSLHGSKPWKPILAPPGDYLLLLVLRSSHAFPQLLLQHPFNFLSIHWFTPAQNLSCKLCPLSPRSSPLPASQRMLPALCFISPLSLGPSPLWPTYESFI